MKFKRYAFLSMMALAVGVFSAAAGNVDRTNPTLSEDFNSMWNQSTAAGTLNLPEGWRIDRNLDAPRVVGAWTSAATGVMYQGGVSLASNASNGTWNFGSSSTPSDRAVGGLTTTVANGTRGVSVMTSITNTDSYPINSLNISYNIEKYRYGANAAGFAVQLYFSHDGQNWVSAGDSFRTFFPADSETIGAAVVPISTTAVENQPLLVDVAANGTVYLAWNISVASGSSPDKAPGLALDDITVTAGFANPDSRYIYVENASGKANLSIYASDTSLFGAAPGSSTTLTKVINGVTYRVWDMPSVASDIQLYAEAGAKTYGPIAVNPKADAYICVSPTDITTISDPDSYTGWVDPDRKPFTASGIFLRGELNSWGAVAEWEFSKESDTE